MMKDGLTFLFTVGALILLNIADLFSTVIALSIEGFIEVNPLWRLLILYFGVRGFIYGKLLLTFSLSVFGIILYHTSEKKQRNNLLLVFAFGCLYYASLLVSNLLGLMRAMV